MIGNTRSDVMKRILLIAGLALGTVGTFAGCYDAAEAGVMNHEDKYECFCGNVKWVAEGSAAPTCHNKEMTHVMRQPSRP
jgi:hypothetical protein